MCICVLVHSVGILCVQKSFIRTYLWLDHVLCEYKYLCQHTHTLYACTSKVCKHIDVHISMHLSNPTVVYTNVNICIELACRHAHTHVQCISRTACGHRCVHTECKVLLCLHTCVLMCTHAPVRKHIIFLYSYTCHGYRYTCASIDTHICTALLCCAVVYIDRNMNTCISLMQLVCSSVRLLPRLFGLRHMFVRALCIYACVQVCV